MAGRTRQPPEREKAETADVRAVCLKHDRAAR